MGKKLYVGNLSYETSQSELEALFGTWTKRARLVIEAEVSDLEVMGLIRSNTGTITNMSPMAPETTP